MNLDALTGWVKSHRSTALGAGAVGAVGGLALYQRRKTTAATTGDAGTPTTNADGSTGYSYGSAGLTGTPDTSSTDLQNAVQGQLNDALDAFQSNVNDQLAGFTPPPAKAAAKPTYSVLKPPPGTKYVRDESQHGVMYQIWPTDGKKHYINGIQWIALGSPNATKVFLEGKPAAPKAAPKPKAKAPAPKAKPVVRAKPAATYTVRSGDNLFDIAKAHRMSLAQLVAKNRQISNPNLIRPGQKIHL